MRVASFPVTLVALGLILMTLVDQSYAGEEFKVGFYKGKCGKNDVEAVISDIVKEKYAEEPDTVSDLVRLTFHDCFVQGCDGSIFLDGPDTEKAAEPSATLNGFDTIDEIKDAIEALCPGVVSCADILMMAARSAIKAAGGNWFDIETGRRDTRVSLKIEALRNIPGPTISVPAAIKLFESRKLSKVDFVVLLAAHTTGTAHCPSFKNRLYNFENTNKPDPTISKPLLQLLQQTCPLNSKVDNEAFLDQTPNSHFTFDNKYYKQIVQNNGTLEIDQQLALHPATKGAVRGFANSSPSKFLDNFGPSLRKMAKIGVLTGNQGEIRKSCRLRK